MVTGVLLLARGAVLPHAIVPPAARPDHGVELRIEDGRITHIAVAGGSGCDHDCLLLPGFVDLQVNGAGGCDVATATPQALDTIAAAVFAGGAVAFLPTLITAPWSTLLERVDAVARWIETWNGSGAEPLGLHLEGPFLEGCGAHDGAHFVDPTPARVAALLAAARGRLALVTLAPSRLHAVDAVRALRGAGVAVALGHARSPAGFAACVDAGASLVTHLFNVMGPLHHREPGVAGLALDERTLTASLICDGVHVDPVMVRLAFAALGVDRTVLITDAVAAAGGPDGAYQLGDDEVTAKDGVVRNAAGELAGSALTMSLAAQRFLAFLDGRVGPWTLARIAATNPARLLGRSDYGSIAPGAKAAFTLARADGTFAALRC